MTTIRLHTITSETIDECLALSVLEEQQQFVASVAKSLAYAYVYPGAAQPFAIYADATMIGYVLVSYDEMDMDYCIWHMLIDSRYQHKGYGKQALQLVLDYAAAYPFGQASFIGLTCHPENTGALHLYEQMGFKQTGDIADDSELILLRSLN